MPVNSSNQKEQELDPIPVRFIYIADHGQDNVVTAGREVSGSRELDPIPGRIYT